MCWRRRERSGSELLTDLLVRKKVLPVNGNSVLTGGKVHVAILWFCFGINICSHKKCLGEKA